MKHKKTNALRKMLTSNKAVAGMDFLQEFIIGLFVVIVIIFIIAIIGADLKTTSRTVTAGAVANETGWINETGYSVENRELRGFSSFVVTAIYNNSDNELLGVANYTVNTNGTIFNASVKIWDDVNITYTFSYLQNTAATGIINNFTT